MAPTQIGRFELIAELGKHPLGMLYKANDPKRGNVALLAIESASLTPQTRQQVQQLFGRARTATVLNSPNIASIFGGGEADGYVHLAMEFVDGVTLRTQMARDGKVSSSELVDIARQLCTALDHAQSKGVVHQNLHPGNVKVEWDGAVKLMDYGLDIPGKHSDGDTALFYSQRYASPEQLRGEPITFRSNLYTLGAMLYELASGQKAIAVEENERVREQVLQGEIPPLRNVFPDVPKAISDAIAKAMAKMPSERIESASALVRELESYRAVKKNPVPVMAATAETPQPSQKPKAAYGGPDTSAIFRAMHDNFKQSASPANGSVAVAELTEEPAQRFPYTAPAEHFTPTHTEVASVTTATPRLEPEAPIAPPAPRPQVSQSNDLISTNETSSYLQNATMAPKPRPATPPPPRPAVSEPQSAEAPRASVHAKPTTAKPLVKAPAKARIVLPEPRKLGLIAAGMLLALTTLWGVSRYYGSNAEATPTPAATTQEQAPASEQQTEAAPTEPAPRDEPEVVVRNMGQQRRGSRKPVQVATVVPIMTGELVVTSVPEGAQIQIDGRADGQWLTPHSVTSIPVGEHTVTISKAGYTTVIKNIEIAANQRQVITIAMQQISAILAVTSEPSGAAIFLDGQPTGKLTPTQLSVSPGMHQVTFRKDGYFEHSGVANAQSNQTSAVNASLVQAGRTDQIESVGKVGKFFGRGGNPDMGRLKVKTQPKGAYITINGKPAPDASPAEFQLNPGTYEVKMQLTGHPDIKRTVQIVKGKRIDLDEVFDPR